MFRLELRRPAEEGDHPLISHRNARVTQRNIFLRSVVVNVTNRRVKNHSRTKALIINLTSATSSEAHQSFGTNAATPSRQNRCIFHPQPTRRDCVRRRTFCNRLINCTLSLSLFITGTFQFQFAIHRVYCMNPCAMFQPRLLLHISCRFQFTLFNATERIDLYI